MIIDKLNIGLIEAIKKKIPSKGSIANLLMDILYIGKEAIYRRLRGEVPFTFAEAAIISRKLEISLDDIIGLYFNDNSTSNRNTAQHNKPER